MLWPKMTIRLILPNKSFVAVIYKMYHMLVEKVKKIKNIRISGVIWVMLSQVAYVRP